MLDTVDLAVADHIVGLAGQDRRDQPWNLAAWILMVAVGVDDDVGAQAQRGVDPGLHCEPNDAEKKPEGSVLPPMPNLQLQTLPPIDWLKMRQAYDLRGSSMSLRDAASLGKEWERSSRLLDTLGINDNFTLGFITKEWILNKGLSLQLDDRLSRENPNYFDRQNLDWKQSHPGSWQTPTIPIFDLDWFRSSKKKK